MRAAAPRRHAAGYELVLQELPVRAPINAEGPEREQLDRRYAERLAGGHPGGEARTATQCSACRRPPEAELRLAGGEELASVPARVFLKRLRNVVVGITKLSKELGKQKWVTSR